MNQVWKRGDVFYIESTETASGRPAVVVSSEKTFDKGFVQIVYLTTQPKEDLLTHIDISSTQRTSVALCEQIRTVPVTRLGDYICSCTEYEMQMIDIALAISLDLNFDRNKNEDFVTETSVIKLKSERDTYKQLYENIIERMMK